MRNQYLSLLITFTLSVAINGFTFAKGLPNGSSKVLPAFAYQLDGQFTHHLLVAEKSTHKLHLFENREGVPRYIKSFDAATGKRKGDKYVQGDLKTPEGIYDFTEFIPNGDLVKKYGEKQAAIYGAGAFVMNYPNPIDQMYGKSGGGIWLHSTNDDSRVNKGLDSRGCVVVVDDHLKEVSKFLELQKTPIIVIQDLKYIPESNGEKDKSEILGLVESWRNAWENENLKQYTSHYHQTKFKDPVRGSYDSFKDYKKKVFWAPGQPRIKINNISILRVGNYAKVGFEQDYKSNTIDDIGKKTLYLMQNRDYEWKIVSEIWHHLPQKEEVAFVPSMRFFNEN
jgi:murein L,D-transpeptidase YafK